MKTEYKRSQRFFKQACLHMHRLATKRNARVQSGLRLASDTVTNSTTKDRQANLRGSIKQVASALEQFRTTCDNRAEASNTCTEHKQGGRTTAHLSCCMQQEGNYKHRRSWRPLWCGGSPTKAYLNTVRIGSSIVGNIRNNLCSNFWKSTTQRSFDIQI
jgi:hypothetical protein